jgi:hypothetical protein
MKKVKLLISDAEATSILRGQMLRGELIDKVVDAIERDFPEIKVKLAAFEEVEKLLTKFYRSPLIREMLKRYHHAHSIISDMELKLNREEKNRLKIEFQKILDKKKIKDFVATENGFEFRKEKGGFHEKN